MTRAAVVLAALLLSACHQTPAGTRGEGVPAGTSLAHALRIDARVDTPRHVSRARPTPRATRAARTELPAVLLRIRRCESHDNYRAKNPRSSASGAWQITDGTWNGWRGYRHAADAPRRVQDAKALALYADRGTQPWRSSRRCWR